MKQTLYLLIILLLSSNFAFAQGDTAASQIADIPACDCPEPKDPEDWGTSMSLGFTLTEGNSNTILLTSAISASREKDNNLWDLRLAGAYGETETDISDAEGNPVRDANGDVLTNDDQTVGEVVALIKYGRLLSDRLYTGAQVDFLHDAIQDIQYRVTLGVPVGYYLVKEDNMRFNIEAGPAYVFKRISHDDSNNWAWFVSERLEYDISETSKFFEQVTYNGSVEDPSGMFEEKDASDDYFVVAEAGLEAAISSSMSLVLSVRDDYINLVGPDKDRNDLAVITAIKVAL